VSTHTGTFRGGSWGTFMGIVETQLKHVGYELDMLVYTFDKLLLVEPLVPRSFQAGQVNALIEAFCIHARNLDEFSRVQVALEPSRRRRSSIAGSSRARTTRSERTS
jgi:hypothetical protein